MSKERLIDARPGVNAAEIRRGMGRRYVAPLIVATLIAAVQIAILRPSTEMNKASRATTEPAINAPAFVRPKRSPDALTVHVVRIAKRAEGRLA